MKILLTEAEKVFANQFLDRLGAMSDEEDLEAVRNIRSIVNKEEIDVKEEYVVETFLRSNFLLDETADAFKELDRSFSGMKNEWKKLSFKLFAKVSKVFLLGNVWTRNFYNDTIYYIASFKEAYNKMLNMNFSYKKESAQDK